MLNFEHKKGDFSFSMTELNNLENNLERAIELIQTLYQKNKELNSYNESLITKINEKEKEIQKLNDQNQFIKNNKNLLQNDNIKENRIRIKIQQILEKLESFEKLSANQ